MWASSQKCWRVFYTMARAEKQCESLLVRKGFDVLLPKAEVMRQWKDRKKKVVEPLFKNYIFACVNEAERLQVLRTQGIVRTVAFQGKLAQLSSHEVEQLRILQRDPFVVRAVGVPLPAKGTAVQVMQGPFQGLQGTVVQHRGKTAIQIQIASIRQAVRVQIQADWVEPATHFSKAA